MNTDANAQGEFLVSATLLVVEDDADTLGVLGRILSRHAGRVLTAATAAEARRLIEAGEVPDLVISDLRIDTEDGLDLIHWIHQRLPDLPAILISAYTDRNSLLRSFEIGVTRVHPKPVDPKTLLQEAEEVLRKAGRRRDVERRLDAATEQLARQAGELQRIESRVGQMLPSVNALDNLHVNYWMKPVGLVSGDILTLVESGPGHLYLLLADATGHGVPALLPAIQIPACFRELALKGYSLEFIAREINNLLCRQNIIEHFVATTLISIDLVQGWVEVANCGNPEAIMIDASGKIVHIFPARHAPLGIAQDGLLDLIPDRFRFNEPLRLYLCSDGLPEMQTAEGGELGMELVYRLLAMPEPESRFGRFVERLNSSDISQHDDVTLVEVNCSLATPTVASQTLQPPAVAAADGEQVLLGKSALLVEDDVQARETLARMLRRRFRQVHVAGDGAEGLAVFRRYRPDVVITDMRMPHMNGAEMIAAIRAIDADVPIFAVSAFEDYATLIRTIHYRLSGFADKPVDFAQFMTQLSSSVRQYSEVQQMRFALQVMFNIQDGVLLTDAASRILFVNPAFCSLTGYAAAEVLGLTPAVLKSGRQSQRFYQEMWKSLQQQGHWSGELWNRRKNGEIYLQWVNISAIRNGDGQITHFASILRDITAQKEMQEKLDHLAHYDELTHLPNRAMFLDRLEQQIWHARRYSRRLAVLFFDLDRFKEVNDSLGHDAGDQLLRSVAERVQACIRQSDTVARLGGDEFTIIVNELNTPDDARFLAEKVIARVTEPYEIDGRMVHVGISIGISSFPEDGTDSRDLVKHADAAMYDAKGHGGNTFRFFSSDLDTVLQRKVRLRHLLHGALDREEFFIHYQPKVAVGEDGEVVGAEALLRWHNQEVGLVSPVEFIPLLEESGHIVRVGSWVLHSVVGQQRAWAAAGRPVVPVAINVSAAQFKRGGLDKELQQLRDDEGLNPAMIHIELTESLLLGNDPEIMQTMQAIEAMGFHFALDDFGTGYSSLSYLSRFPIRTLKIDRSFMQGIENLEARPSALATAIIQMAKALGMNVVAEGVESEAQLRFLRAQGCDQMQGFLFSPGVGSDEFAKLL